jgi:FkbM family methyltransferase
MFFFDLGACEGRFSIYAALKGLRVYSLEPNRANFDVMQMNIKLNRLEDKIKVFNLGVGEKNQDAILQIGQPWAGGHQKVVRHNQVRSDLSFSFVETEQIKIVSLDSLVSLKGLETPFAMKIDIDGSEVPFLKGALNILKNRLLKKIIFELDKQDSNFDFIIGVLSDSGFKIQQSYQVPNEPSLFNILFVK